MNLVIMRKSRNALGNDKISANIEQTITHSKLYQFLGIG